MKETFRIETEKEIESDTKRRRVGKRVEQRKIVMQTKKEIRVRKTEGYRQRNREGRRKSE